MTHGGYKVGDRVRALIDCDSDLRDDGMGIERCCSRGEELIVRGLSKYSEKRLHVSHESVTDRSFTVELHEIEPASVVKEDGNG